MLRRNHEAASATNGFCCEVWNSHFATAAPAFITLSPENGLAFYPTIHDSWFSTTSAVITIWVSDENSAFHHLWSQCLNSQDKTHQCLVHSCVGERSMWVLTCTV